jgi:hypothetical protein
MKYYFLHIFACLFPDCVSRLIEEVKEVRTVILVRSITNNIREYCYVRI